jgi:hypothetical protein
METSALDLIEPYINAGDEADIDDEASSGRERCQTGNLSQR